MAEPTLQLRVDAPTATVILNRPTCGNALDRRQVQDLLQALEDLHAERRVRAVVLTGAGDHFCSGTDLRELQQSLDSRDALRLWHQDTQQLLELIERLLRFPKPVVAGVQGVAAGTGCALALAADVLIGSPQTRFILPESRLGLSSGLSTPLVSFRIGTSMASRMVFSGNEFNFEAAANAGLIHEVVPADLVWVKSNEIAQQCAIGARESHQMSKHMINETVGETLFTQLSIGAANMAAARTTDAAREGIAAFFEKRSPDWDRLAEIR